MNGYSNSLNQQQQRQNEASSRVFASACLSTIVQVYGDEYITQDHAFVTHNDQPFILSTVAY